VDREVAMDHPQTKPRIEWLVFTRLLDKYFRRYAAAKLAGLAECPGKYLVISAFVLGVVAFLSSCAKVNSVVWLLVVFWIVAVYYIVDALLVNTRIAYTIQLPICRFGRSFSLS
jgi:hypothetical protein